MPAAKCTPDMLDWLNHMLMVYDHHGRIVPSKARECVANVANDPATYELGGSGGNFVIHHYADCRLVSIAGGIADAAAEDAWYNEDEGRKQWDALVASGFFRLSEVSA